MARLSEWLRGRDRTFLFELLVPATTAQLDSFEGHQQDYDRHLRPRVVVQANILFLKIRSVGASVSRGLTAVDVQDHSSDE